MEITVLKDSKDEIEVKVDDSTIVEIMRVYLNKDPAVTFAAWKEGETSKEFILAVKTKGKTAKKAVNDAASMIDKDLDKVLNDFKKLF